MLPYVEALAATSAALRRAVTPQAGAIGGTVRITASEIVGVERLPPILAAIRHRHPGLTLELALSNEVEDLLRRDADIAVRMVAPAQEALIARRLGAVEIGLFARADYLARARRAARTSPTSTASTSLASTGRRRRCARWPGASPGSGASASPSAPTATSPSSRRSGPASGSAAARPASPLATRAWSGCCRGPSLSSCRVWLVMHEDLRASPRCRAVFDLLAGRLAAELD